MYIKIHKSYRIVVALCDSDLIGRKFEEGNRQLHIKENFFKGEEISYEKALEIIKFYTYEDSTFNIAGQEAVKAALQAGIINKQGIAYVQGVPFTLVLI